MHGADPPLLRIFSVIQNIAKLMASATIGCIITKMDCHICDRIGHQMDYVYVPKGPSYHFYHLTSGLSQLNRNGGDEDLQKIFVGIQKDARD